MKLSLRERIRQLERQVFDLKILPTDNGVPKTGDLVKTRLNGKFVICEIVGYADLPGWYKLERVKRRTSRFKRKAEDFALIGDGRVAGIFSDWLEQNGYDAAATAFRKTFIPELAEEDDG